MNLKLQNEKATSLDNALDDIIKSVDLLKDHTALSSPGYDTGLLGISLFYTLLYDDSKHTPYMDTAYEFFEKGLYAINSDFHPTYINDSLDSHLGQIGRFIHFILQHPNYEGYDFTDYLNQLDQLLSSLYPSKVEKGDFDITSGALASGFYYLTRDNEVSAEALAHIVRGIYNARKVSHKGYYWVVPTLGNRIYLGLSHGSAMMINFLTSVYNKGIAKDLCEDLIYNASKYLINNKRINKHKGLFDNFIGEDPEPKQFSLCYGDIGNGIALLQAGKVLNNTLFITEAHSILEDCLTRKFEDKLTLDASIYYGASGLNIAFQKLYTLTDKEEYKNRSEYWLNTIPGYKIHDNEYAGFKTRLIDQLLSWNVCHGWGILGIGSVILNNRTQSFKSLSPLTLLT
nr:lanthionine synthetase LanC family protein [uncultured Chryseobacterium sp.]